MADSPPDTHTLTVTAQQAGMRLDKYLASALPDFSRSRVQGLLEAAQIARLSPPGATIVEASQKVKPGERYRVTIPPAAPSHIRPQAIALDVIYEDGDLLVINKPPGMTVHPAPGSPDRTLVNALLAHCGASLSGIGGVARPGIVHRIDKDTSGLLVVAKNDAAHASLAAQLAARTLKRIYVAMVWGVPKPAAGKIAGNIGRSPKNRKKMALLKTGGKPAVTHYKVMRVLSGGIASLVECRLETGRTHQIRVHLAHSGHGIIGDPTYGTSSRSRVTGAKTLSLEAKEFLTQFPRQALHARALRLEHPASGKPMEFEAPLPQDLQALQTVLEG